MTGSNRCSIPAHQEAVLEESNAKPFMPRPAGRLELAVPESKTLLDLAFTQGESAGSQTAQLTQIAGRVWSRRPCAAPSWKPWNATRRAPPPSPSCCAVSPAPTRIAARSEPPSASAIH